MDAAALPQRHPQTQQINLRTLQKNPLPMFPPHLNPQPTRLGLLPLPKLLRDRIQRHRTIQHLRQPQPIPELYPPEYHSGVDEDVDEGAEGATHSLTGDICECLCESIEFAYFAE